MLEFEPTRRPIISLRRFTRELLLSEESLELSLQVGGCNRAKFRKFFFLGVDAGCFLRALEEMVRRHHRQKWGWEL